MLPTFAKVATLRRISSAGERLPYKQDVTSSILVSSIRSVISADLFLFPLEAVWLLIVATS